MRAGTPLTTLRRAAPPPRLARALGGGGFVGSLLTPPRPPGVGGGGGGGGGAAAQGFRPVNASPPAGGEGSRITDYISPFSPDPGRRAGDEGRGGTRTSAGERPSPCRGRGFSDHGLRIPFLPGSGRRAGDKGRGGTRTSAGERRSPCPLPLPGERVLGSQITYPPSPRTRGEGPGMRGAAAQGFRPACLAGACGGVWTVPAPQAPIASATYPHGPSR